MISRKRLADLLCIALVLAAPTDAFTRTDHRHTHFLRFASHRMARGRLPRDRMARDAFKAAWPCPVSGRSRGRCPGYVIDHVQALKRGGRDDASNMQWQTIEAARAKDSVE